MAALDREALVRPVALIGDYQANLTGLMEIYMLDAGRLSASLELGAELCEMARATHSLKSNARALGATHRSSPCRSLDGDLKLGLSSDDLPDFLEAKMAAWPEVRATIEQEFAARCPK